MHESHSLTKNKQGLRERAQMSGAHWARSDFCERRLSALHFKNVSDERERAQFFGLSADLSALKFELYDQYFLARKKEQN